MSASGPVVVEIVGGLGNQLFQYAAGRALALKTGAELVLDLRLYQVYHRRRFELDRLKTGGRLATPAEHALFGHMTHSQNRLVRKIQRTLDPLVARGVVYDEKRDFVYDEAVSRLRPPTLLRGYWQSPRYFESIRARLLEEIQPREPLDDGFQARLDEIRREPCAVSINVRRGEYVSNPSVAAEFGSCSVRYYDEAAARIREAHPGARFFVFSDDIAWCRENVRAGGAPIVYADTEGPDKALADLMLMRACRHHVVANSSFSWWGAWLAEEAGHQVIAPKRWMASVDVDDRDLIPSNWTRIDN